MHSTSSNTSRLTCVTPGIYVVCCRAFWAAAAASGPTYVGLYKNGSGVTFSSANWINSASISTVTELNEPIVLAAGDYIEMKAYQSTGATRALVSGTGGATFSAVLVSSTS
jgi:hypothetical protein